MRIIGVIPARHASKRLPGKVLLDIGGKSILEHVWQRVQATSGLDDVLVATDSEEIKQVARGFGARVEITSPDHISGTDRIVEVATKHNFDVAVNIQGDEPFIEPESIQMLIDAFRDSTREFRVATLCTQSNDVEELNNPNVVKVVRDHFARALYFSRAPIPFHREGGDVSFMKHLGIYAYTKDFLLEYSNMRASRLEEVERLEQLRMLDSGETLQVLETPFDSLGVDTEEDLREAREIYSRKV